MTRDLRHRLIDGLIRYRWAWLLVAVVLTGLAIVPAQKLTFDHSIESLYAAGNPRLLDYNHSKSLFGGDEFVFLAYTDPDLFEDAGQARLTQLTEQVAEVPGVVASSVQSLATYLEITKHPVFRSRRPAVIEFARGVLLGTDDQTAAVALRLADESQAPVPRAETIDQLRKIAAKAPLPTYVAGEPVLVYDMFNYAQNDGEFMGWAASGLLMGVIVVFLRDLRSIVLPFLIVQMTILWTKAALWATHMQLTMVSSVLGSLVTIIGVSTVVYLSLYYQKLREEAGRVEAFRRMLSVVGMDIVWVCLTTAAGFAAQLTSHLHPVRSFGLTMVMGSLLVLLAMILVLPGGMLIGRERSRPPKPRGEQQVNQSLFRLTNWVLKHPGWIGLLTVLAVAFGVSGLLRLKIETDFSRNFRASTPVVQSLNFLETRLGGMGLWEVNFPAPAEWDAEHLDHVRRLAEKLRQIKIGDEPGLTKVVAITDGLDLIPTVPILIPNAAAQVGWLNRLQPEFVPSLFNADEGRMRIMLRSREHQSAERKQELISRVTEIAQEEFAESKVTGLFVLLTYLIDSLLQDQWTDLAVAACGLIAIMTIAYRSAWMGVISLIPNVLPVVLLLGCMGWAGLRVNIGTAMISSDTMGLTIHDSIFYLSAYLRARRSGLDFYGALTEVQTEVRRPLIYSNIALILGFLVLTTSHFVPLIYFGALVSTAIAGGLVVNLLLLPLLLQLGNWRASPEKLAEAAATESVLTTDGTEDHGSKAD